MYVRYLPWFLLDLATNNLNEMKGKIYIERFTTKSIDDIYVNLFYSKLSLLYGCNTIILYSVHDLKCL